MATLGGYYLNPHRTQFDGSVYEDQNCTPTSVANGANAATGGQVNMSGGQVRALIPRSQESDPVTPGWSMVDADHAAAKMGVAFTNHDGDGWAALTSFLATGHYVDCQGDSDQFSNSTCSGAFNGNHCIGIHPATRVVNGLRQHWIDDPICKTGRWEYDYILHRYAAKLNSGIWFGVFDHAVPKAVTTPPATYRLHISAGATVKVANFAGKCIKSWTSYHWGSKPSSAPCGTPHKVAQCAGKDATVVRVTAGKFAGKYVHIGAGVSAVKV
jgi:hypothetical protein